MANGPFIDDLPIQSGDFPQLCSIKGDGHQSINRDFYMIPIFRMPVGRTTKDHIPCFDPSEYWAGSFVLSWSFLFWDYPIIKPLNVESYPIRDTQTHLYAYCIYNRYQFVGLPKLSWVIHCTSFLVANGENGEYVTINHVSFLLQNVEPGTFRWWCTHCNLHNMLMYDAIENQWNLSLLLR